MKAQGWFARFGVGVFLASLALLTGCAAPQTPQPPSGTTMPMPQRETLLLVSVDGLLPETYLNPDGHGLRIPTLRRLKAEGAWSTGVTSVFPTLTYPAHTTLATGVTPSVHGIVTNRVLDGEERNPEGWRFFAPQIHATSLFEVASAAGIRTALVHWPVSLGAKVDLNVPEFWRSRGENNAELLRAASTPGLLDAVAQSVPDFWQRYTPPSVRDSALTDIATYAISKRHAHFVAVHLVEVDGEQHHYGVWSPQALAAIENADTQIARLMAASGPNVTVAVASDHGFANTKKLVRPGVLLRTAGLVTLNGTGEVTDWTSTVVATGGNAYVYLKNPADTQAQRRTLEVFVAESSRPGSSIRALYTQEEIARRGGDPSAFIALEAAPGYQFEGSALGDFERPGGYLATHGYDPAREDMRASFILSGKAIHAQALGAIRLVDIAPTLAHRLGLSLPNAAGRDVLGTNTSKP